MIESDAGQPGAPGVWDRSFTKRLLVGAMVVVASRQPSTIRGRKPACRRRHRKRVVLSEKMTKPIQAQDLSHDIPFHIRSTEVPPWKRVGDVRVNEPKQAQERGVESEHHFVTSPHEKPNSSVWPMVIPV